MIFLVVPVLAGRGGKSRKMTKTGIDTVGQGISKAFSARDIRKLMSFYAGHFMSGTVPTRNDLGRKMVAIFRRYYNLRLTRSRVGSVYVCRPYAREIVDEIFVAKAVAPPEKLTVTKRKLIAYENCGGRWLITGEEEIDIDGESRINKQTYSDPERGFQIRAPRDWHMNVIKNPLMSLLVITSPDMRSSLSIGRTRVSVRTSAKQVLDEDIAATMELPDMENVERGPVTLAGIKGYQITSDVKFADRMPRVRRAYFANGRDLLFVISSAESGPVFEAAEDDFDKVLASLQLTAPRLNPALGSIKEGVYRNRKYNCEFMLPNGWETDVEKGRGEFKVSFASNDGVVDGVFICIRPRGKASTELMVMTDEYEIRRVGVDYELIRRGAVSCANVNGYGTLSRFKLAGRSCVRRRAYFRSGGFMYCLVVNTRPSDKYNEKAPEIGALARSIRLGRLR